MFAAPVIWYRCNKKYLWYTKEDAREDKVEIMMLLIGFVLWPFGFLFLLWYILKAEYGKLLPDKPKRY